MIRPLRRLHLGTSVVLGLAVPVGLVLAVRARVPMPVVPTPLPLVGPILPTAAGEDRSAIWTDVEVETRVWSDGPEGEPLLALAPRADLQRPDVLLYWEDATAIRADEEQPATAAHLLGSVAGTERRLYVLPRDARSRDGRLVLYSLGHRAILHAAPLPAVGD